MKTHLFCFRIILLAANCIGPFFSMNSFSQASNLQYGGFFEKVMSGNLCPEDFRDSTIFLTLDTINTADVNAPSTFIETKDVGRVIESFNNFLTTFKHDRKMFFYSEIIKSFLHDDRNVLVGCLNTEKNTYRLNLWMDKNRPFLIEGITIGKYPTKTEPRGDVFYLLP